MNTFLSGPLESCLRGSRVRKNSRLRNEGLCVHFCYPMLAKEEEHPEISRHLVWRPTASGQISTSLGPFNTSKYAEMSKQ